VEKKWTEAVFANSRQEMILKAFGQPLGTGIGKLLGNS
jgi:hypothetical protein